ncbi:hypothetical protein QLS91_11770 [Flavobacterium sp. LB2P84]|uniref:Uncharacterized protein n=1 Tax=Flavobacterium yafengii TaxID=3041253 RepID=A0AAW6TPG5_9FLAO|nr:hypothetical protein [Flavobacterium yafengii]MDI5950341.1 hypothetical protein [Flavobacterium yafengii]MDI6033752.1 hypothetical protein [Flavobacterium yafengii]
MTRKKGLVYDNQKYFSRLLKYEFQEDLSFDTYCDFKYFDVALNDYSIIIFVIYSEEELFDFMKVYKKGIPLIMCTFSKERFMKLQKIDDLILLDTSKIRAEIVTDLKYYFNLVNAL